MAGIKRGIIFRQVIANLNAAPGDYVNAVSQDEAYDDLAVMDAILNQEAYLLHKIAESWFNGNRTNETPLADLIKTVDVVHGALIPRHVGPIIGVTIDGMVAEYVAGAAADRLRQRNVLKLQLQGQLYGLRDNQLFFTGENLTIPAQVTIFQYARPDFADDIADFKDSDSPVPAEYMQSWIDLSTGAVMPREGSLMNAAAMHRRLGEGVPVELERENKLRPQSADSQRSGA